jgi:predicted PurR-regulated permease PerM
MADPAPPAPSPPAPPSSPTPPESPFTWFRRLAKLWGFLGFILVVAWFFRAVLLPFVLAVLVAYILAPAVDRMARWRIGKRVFPRGGAVILCYVLLLAIIAVFFTAFLPRLSNDFARLGAETPRLWEKAQKEWVPQAARWLEKEFPSLAPAASEPAPVENVGVTLPPPPGTLFTVTPLANGEYAVVIHDKAIEVVKRGESRLLVRAAEENEARRLEDILRERLLKLVAGLEGELSSLIKLGQALVAGIITLIVQTVLVLMVAAFLLIDLSRVHAFARSLVPGRYRGEYDQVAAGIDRGLSGVIRGQLLICLVNGVLTYIGILIFQVKYGLLLAVIAAVLSLVPIFGTIISSIPIVAVAMVSGDAGFDVVRGALVLGWILLIHFIEANVLNPKILGTAAKMHPVLVVFALIAGEHTYGIVGALLAVPVASIIQTLFVYFRSRAWRSPETSGQMPAVTG